MDESEGTAPASGWRLLRQNPGLLLTVAYLFLTAIGAFYDWRLCSRFGVGVFDLADASDFLKLAVRDLLVLSFALLPVVLFGTVHARFVRAPGGSVIRIASESCRSGPARAAAVGAAARVARRPGERASEIDLPGPPETEGIEEETGPGACGPGRVAGIR